MCPPQQLTAMKLSIYLFVCLSVSLQVRVFNKSGTVIAAQWSTDAATWVEIGEVTGSGSSDGGEVHGVVYDHVMPVEIDTATGVVTLQLGYNESENPFISAQRFIDQNQLDQNYLSQIADFITARAGKPSAPTFDMGQPSSSSSSNASSSSGSGSHLMDLVDDTSSKRPRHNYTLLPLQAYFSYEDIPGGLQTKFMAKIRDFNSAFAASVDGSTGRGVLSETDLSVLEDCLGVLADTSHYHSSRLPKNTVAVLHTMLTHWTQEQGRTLFPSFDLLRMISAHPSGSQLLANSPYLPALLSRTIQEVVQDFRTGTMDADVSSSLLSADCRPAASPQALTALRFLATSCRHSLLRQKVLALLLTPPSSQTPSETEAVFASLSSFVSSLGELSSSSTIKPIHRHALTSWCANVVLACCVGEGGSGAGLRDVLQTYYPSVVWLLQQEQDSVDVVVRSVLAVGTVAVDNNSLVTDPVKSDVQSQTLVKSVLTTVQDRWSGKKSDYVDLCLVEVTAALDNQ